MTCYYEEAFRKVLHSSPWKAHSSSLCNRVFDTDSLSHILMQLRAGRSTTGHSQNTSGLEISSTRWMIILYQIGDVGESFQKGTTSYPRYRSGGGHRGAIAPTNWRGYRGLCTVPHAHVMQGSTERGVIRGRLTRSSERDRAIRSEEHTSELQSPA